MKKWQIAAGGKAKKSGHTRDNLIALLLTNRGVTTKQDIEEFLTPPNPINLTSKDVGIAPAALKKALARIQRAIEKKESVIVYADYDADGITAGAILWETLYRAGAHVMPYIPHREKEGYGLSVAGIDAVRAAHDPSLIITVDHGITAWEKVEYAKKLGIEPEKLKVGLKTPIIGNTYSAASPIGLCAVLDVAKPGEKILLASFGSGAGSDAFAITVCDLVEERRKIGPSLDSFVQNKEYLSYALYAKHRRKLKSL